MTNRNRLEQQETERLHIEEFLRRIGINCSVEFGDVPDAVLLVEGRRVGVEHRELTEQALAAGRQNIGTLESGLQRELERLGLGPEFSVDLAVNPGAPVFRRRSDVEALAGRVARVVLDRASVLGVGASVSINAPELALNGFAELVIFLKVERRTSGDIGGAHAVSITPGFWGPGDSSVRAAIAAKEERLAAYKAEKALDAVWLLLVTGESWVQATDSVLTEWLRISSRFDAVYLLDTRTGQLQRLDVSRGR